MSASGSSPKTEASNNQPWTEKYKPTSYQQITGNRAFAEKVGEWLKNWENNEKMRKRKTPYQREIQYYSAIIISGPPGIGKTTTAHLAAKICNYDVLEFNASDARNKKSVEDYISTVVTNRTVVEYFSEAGQPEDAIKKKTMLIMDEVDGMSSGDQGGVAALVSVIKKSKIPVICICNDIYSRKLDTLKFYCYNVRFARIPLQPMTGSIMSILHKEKLHIKPDVLRSIIQSAQCDYRQALNTLANYKLVHNNVDAEQVKGLCSGSVRDVELGIFETPKMLLDSNSWKETSLSDQIDMCFYDYSMLPMMIAENYVKYKPEKVNLAERGEQCKPPDLIHLGLLAAAADSIADGDVLSTLLYKGDQQWDLLPHHNTMACIRPASFVNGRLTGDGLNQLSFPAFLGQNSKAEKGQRQLHHIKTRMRFKAFTTKSELRCHYLPAISTRLFSDMKNKNFKGVIDTLNGYHLERETVDTLSEIMMKQYIEIPVLESKDKRKLTMQYNKTPRQNPFPRMNEKSKKVFEDSETTEYMSEEETMFN